MTRQTDNPWLVENVDQDLVERLAARHTPHPRGVELGGHRGGRAPARRRR